MNKTQAKWEKSELLQLYKKNRNSKRCRVVKSLKAEADKLTKDLNAEIGALQKQVSETLEKNKLVHFGEDGYACNPDKHETLSTFDIITDKSIQEIINGTFEGLVTD